MPVGVSAYIPLATVTLGSAISSVTFSSIPATYRDLIVVINGTIVSSSDIFYRLNADSGANYSNVWMFGSSTTNGSSRNTGVNQGVTHYADSGSRFTSTFVIMDYSATDKHKTAISRGNSTTGLSISYASRWANTAAVTSLICGALGTNLSSGTTISLYGIAS
jgi:hypothetical protein